MGWIIPDTFEVPKSQSSWIAAPKSAVKPQIDNEEEKKKLFGIELAKEVGAFQAACNICGQNTNEALWISQNWLSDPIVIASKDLYLDNLEKAHSLLDKEQLAARLLQMSDERNQSGTFYILDGKDRLKALELYAKVRGYLDDKSNILPNTFINSMVVKFVRPEIKEEKQIVIDNEPVIEEKPALKIKLVG